MRNPLARGFALCIWFDAINLVAAQAISSGLPTVEEFHSALTACATGSQVKFDANLIGSVSEIYKNNRDKISGHADVEIQTTFLNSLPESQRLEGYRLFVECITSLLVAREEKEDPFDKVNDFIGSFRVDTPTSKILQALGEPESQTNNIRDEDDKKVFPQFHVTFRSYDIGDDSQFFVLKTSNSDEYIASGVKEWPEDNSKPLTVPFLGFSASESNSELVTNIGDFKLGYLRDNCDDLFNKKFSVLNINPRWFYFYVNNCDFGGKANHYMVFHFIFMMGSLEDDNAVLRALEQCPPLDPDKALNDKSCTGWYSLTPVIAFATTKPLEGDGLMDFLAYRYFWNQ